ncbi:MAG: carboxypeptidase regulatory-like domain-containing protein [Bacteroidota bacterium]
MNNTYKLSGLVLCLLLLLSPSLFAQVSAGGTPYGLSNEFQSQYRQSVLPATPVQALDMRRIKKEDEEKIGTVRFAAPIPVDFNMARSGQWTELKNGDRVWRLKLQSKGALGLFVVYEDFFLPFGSRLFMYSEDGQQIKGAYTHKNNTESGRFMTGMINGETAIIEYYEPQGVRGQGRLQIGRVFNSYQRELMEPDDYPYKANSAAFDFGESLSCNVNVNCPAGADWQDEKQGIVRILRVFEEGIGWCSGSLINNTNEDGTPYVLSAYHCWAGFTPEMDLWRFDFNYETDGCANPALEPGYQSILGATYRAGREQSDFLLLELPRRVPYSYNAYFNGWNRDSTDLPTNSAGIHHPQGDIRKISIENDPATIFSSSIPWSNNVTTPANHHIRVEFDEGSFESGSSGSPLFDDNRYIVGQLHGGSASCFAFRAFYGRFSKSWNAGSTVDARLREWLDPAGTGVLQLGPYIPPPASSISGTITDPAGVPMPNVTVYLGGDLIDSVSTNTNGFYSFEVPVGGDYTITPFKDTNPQNGVSTFDIVLIQKHILQVQPFTEPYQFLAADVNNSGTVTTFDVVNTRKVILLIEDNFLGSPSWRFDQPVLTIQDLSGDLIGQDFMGYKVGDVTGNADPGG